MASVSRPLELLAIDVGLELARPSGRAADINARARNRQGHSLPLHSVATVGTRIRSGATGPDAGRVRARARDTRTLVRTARPLARWPANSDHKPMTVPRCAALRRDRAPCGALASSPTASFCRHHERLVETHGEEAVRNGRYPRTRTPRPRAPLEAELESEAASNGANGVTPAAVRPALAQAAADELGTITAVLMDAATNTTRPVWTTPCCPECCTQFRQEVHIPDHKARVSAVEVLLREGLGRPGQAEEPTKPRLPENAEAVRNMSWDDLQVLFATTYVDEIAAVVNGDGRELLRERLERLSEDERNVLCEELVAMAA